MNILGKKGLVGAVKFFMDLVFIAGIAIYISLPITLKWYFEGVSRINADSQLANSIDKDTAIFVNIVSRENYYFSLVLFLLSGFFALVIIFEMRRLLARIGKMTPFVIENYKSFRNISLSSLSIAVLFAIKMFFYNSFLTIVITMIFFLGSLFAIILAEVFKQAALIKEENDLTV
ncbi:MAG: DUF2975 domain-containing protein [Ignavibacteriales bacterium]